MALIKKDTVTANGAVSNSTSNSSIVDYFARAATILDRTQAQVNEDMEKIFKEDKELAVKVIFYMRTITRQIKGTFESTKVQKGQGVRNEFRKAIAWMAINEPEILYKNLWLVPLVGTWKDLWHSDLIAVLDPVKVYELVAEGIHNSFMKDLVAKYLPQRRSKSNVKNDRHVALNNWVKGFLNESGWKYIDYRAFKVTGNAHEFQKLISKGYFSQIDFNKIPGKALFNFSQKTGKDKKTFIQRHNLEQVFDKWLDTQPVAKFTGYVHELYKAWEKSNQNAIKNKVLNKQFDGLIQLAKKDGTQGLDGNVFVAYDTSSSMTWYDVDNQGTQPLHVCLALTAYFATMNEGAFHKHAIAFSSTSRVVSLKGSFTDMCLQLLQLGAGGGTNFQSVIDEIVRVRKAKPSIPLSDYPKTILVVSDMQFNPYGSNKKTNYEAAMNKLKAVGITDMKFIWWQVNGAYSKDSPSTMYDAGTTLISGFDGSIITSLVGGKQTVEDEKTGKVRALNPYEQMLKALDQEILSQVKI